jgi:glycosyltransferase involved in cell wall biosynthesis
LLPSYFENFPLVVLEAAAAGLTIIATPVGATPEFFSDGKSIMFVRPKDSAQLADAMARVASNEPEAINLAQDARRIFVETLSRRRIAEALAGAYDAALRSRNPTGVAEPTSPARRAASQ